MKIGVGVKAIDSTGAGATMYGCNLSNVKRVAFQFVKQMSPACSNIHFRDKRRPSKEMRDENRICRQ